MCLFIKPSLVVINTLARIKLDPPFNVTYQKTQLPTNQSDCFLLILIVSCIFYIVKKNFCAVKFVTGLNATNIFAFQIFPSHP
jgi:hypothetical protein